MQIAVSVPNMADPRDLVDLAIEAESLGVQGFFLWDHIRFHRGANLDIHDPWVILGAIAHATRTIKLGTLITPPARRRPAKLGKEIVTLDHLSGGRLICGFGVGEPDDADFSDLGDPGDKKTRARLTDISLDIIDTICRCDPVDVTDGPVHVHGLLRPGSLQQPRPPFWIAAMAPHTRSRARAGRWDGVVPIGPDGSPMRPADLANYVKDLQGHPDFDVVATLHPDHTPEEYMQHGCTWTVLSTWPVDGWVQSIRSRMAEISE